MKKITAFKITTLLLVVLPCFFSACIKDSCKVSHTYTFYRPVYHTRQDVRDNIKSNAPQPIKNPGKIVVLGHTIFLNEIDKGIHVVDNTDPSHPRNMAFIDIPGNLDLAVKGTTLYADLYTDLVTLNISNPAQVHVEKINDGLFPFRQYDGFVADQSQIIVDWIRVDTTVTESCTKQGSFHSIPDILMFSAASQTGNSSPKAAVGVTGSMARFAIMNDRLYTVTTDGLNVLNISHPANPSVANHINIGWSIETIFPFKDKLFIGAQAGMYFYNVTNPDAPVLAGQFVHARSCDPVVADDNYAFVTLSTGSFCAGATNELEIIRLNNFVAPDLQKAYPFTNPKGLTKDGNLLFICDGGVGVKLFDASDVMALRPIKVISDIDPYDIIAYNNWALVVAKDGLYQYDYTTPANMHLLSKLSVTK